jgi:hypothetical protein
MSASPEIQAFLKKASAGFNFSKILRLLAVSVGIFLFVSLQKYKNTLQSFPNKQVVQN